MMTDIAAKELYMKKLNKSGHMPVNPIAAERYKQAFGKDMPTGIDYSSESTPPPTSDAATDDILATEESE